MLVERMADPGLELLVAARRERSRPRSCPPHPKGSSEPFGPFAAHAFLTGGRAPLDLAAVAGLASSVGQLLLERGLALIELNPVLVYERGGRGGGRRRAMRVTVAGAGLAGLTAAYELQRGRRGAGAEGARPRGRMEGAIRSGRRAARALLGSPSGARA